MKNSPLGNKKHLSLLKLKITLSVMAHTQLTYPIQLNVCQHLKTEDCIINDMLYTVQGPIEYFCEKFEI